MGESRLQVNSLSGTQECRSAKNCKDRSRAAGSFGETARKVADRQEEGPDREDRSLSADDRAQERRERLERMQERRRERMEELRQQEQRRRKRERMEQEYEQRRLVRKLRLKAYTEKMMLKKIDDRQRMEERNAKIVLARATHGRLPSDKRVRPPRVIHVKPACVYGRMKLF